MYNGEKGLQKPVVQNAHLEVPIQNKKYLCFLRIYVERMSVLEITEKHVKVLFSSKYKASETKN